MMTPLCVILSEALQMRSRRIFALSMFAIFCSARRSLDYARDDAVGRWIGYARGDMVGGLDCTNLWDYPPRGSLWWQFAMIGWVFTKFS